jgi:hypothetical protein
MKDNVRQASVWPGYGYYSLPLEPGDDHSCVMDRPSVHNRGSAPPPFRVYLHTDRAISVSPLVSLHPGAGRCRSVGDAVPVLPQWCCAQCVGGSTLVLLLFFLVEDTAYAPRSDLRGVFAVWGQHCRSEWVQLRTRETRDQGSGVTRDLGPHQESLAGTPLPPPCRPRTPGSAWRRSPSAPDPAR